MGSTAEDDAVAPYARDDMRDAVLDFMRNADEDNGSLGKLLIGTSSSSHTATSRLSRATSGGGTSIFDVILTRKDFRKMLGTLSMKLREDEEVTIFESFDFNGDGAIQCSDLHKLPTWALFDSDSLEISSVLQTWICQSGPKELSRELSGDGLATPLSRQSCSGEGSQESMRIGCSPDVIGDTSLL